MQKDAGDCAVACLQMLLGKPRTDVLAAFPKRIHKRAFNSAEGVSNRQVINAARKLGVTLAYRKGHPDGAVGILDLQRLVDPNDPHGPWEGHYVITANNTCYNPADGMWWVDVDCFFAARRWEPVGVFVHRGRDKGDTH